MLVINYLVATNYCIEYCTTLPPIEAMLNGNRFGNKTTKIVVENIYIEGNYKKKKEALCIIMFKIITNCR